MKNTFHFIYGLRFIFSGLLISSGFTGSLWTQTGSNLKFQCIYIEQDTVKIDSLPIAPGSLIITKATGFPLVPESYLCNEAQATIIFSDSLLRQNLCFRYRTLPLASSYSLREIKSGILPGQPTSIQKITNQSASYSPFPDQTLERRGSISRGIGFGNNQNVVVNSNLNLQIAGNITPDITLMAAISDANVPVQPDGYSQNLREFDKVYIQLESDDFQITAGDFEIVAKEDRFLRMYRKSQGIRFQSEHLLKKDSSLHWKESVSLSVSKGKYNRQSISALEGVQGPYRLKGAAGEPYITVLAGTERVYIDGRLMVRGQDNDYIIDYNTAELSFTPRQPITREKRIMVEFEYSDFTYVRTMVTSRNEFQYRQGKMWVDFVSEQDSRNQTTGISLKDTDKRILAQAGDDPDKAIISGSDSLAFTLAEIRYRKTDTLADGKLYSIFVYSTNPDSAFFRVAFSYMGPGKGNYVLTGNAANGKVFQWIAPKEGQNQGEYEPVRPIKPPQLRQMFDLGGEMFLSKHTQINFELGMTRDDANRYSELNTKDDLGFAGRLGIKHEFLSDTNNIMAGINANSLFIHRYFSPPERFRPVEFIRDWNLAGITDPSDEVFLAASMYAQKRKTGSFIYTLEYMKRGSSYEGNRNNVEGILDKKNIYAHLNVSYLVNQTPVSRGSFLRGNSGLKYRNGWMQSGVQTESEVNRHQATSSDSLLGDSFQWLAWEVFAGNADSSRIPVLLKYRTRNDQGVLSGNLRNLAKSNDLSFQLNAPDLRHQKAAFLLTYRKFSSGDSLLRTTAPEQTLTGRIEHSLRLVRGFFTLQSWYETGTGLEARKEYAYIEVAPGQGQFTWIDFNKNGIRELNEFEQAVFSDQASFLRVYTPSVQYIRVVRNQFSELVSLQPRNLIKNREGIKGIISGFSLQFAWKSEFRNQNGSLQDALNPFAYETASPTSIVFLNTHNRSRLSFSPKKGNWEMSYIRLVVNNQNLMLNGLESRWQDQQIVHLNLNLNSWLDLLLKGEKGVQGMNSEFFSEKNYSIQNQLGELQLLFKPTQSLRLESSLLLNEKREQETTHSVQLHSLSLGGRYNIPNQGTANLNIRGVSIRGEVEPSSSAGYIMLEGLQPGFNGIWEAGFSKSLVSGLEIQISYAGRKADKAKIIHSGQVQVKATF